MTSVQASKKINPIEKAARAFLASAQKSKLGNEDIMWSVAMIMDSMGLYLKDAIWPHKKLMECSQRMTPEFRRYLERLKRNKHKR